MRRPLAIPALVLVALLLGACSPGWIDSGQEAGSRDVTLTPGHSVGQSFVARYGGLNGVYVVLSPVTSCGEGSVRLDLLDASSGDSVLASATVPVAAVTGEAWYEFDFASIPASAGEYYHARFSLADETCPAILLGAGPPDTYSNGSAYRDGEPIEAQLKFRLVHERAGMLVDLLAWAAAAFDVVAFAAFLFVVPAVALGLWATGARGLEVAALATGMGGLGIALYPVMMVLADLAGLRPGRLYVWLPGMIGLAAIICCLRRAWATLPQRVRAWASGETFWPDLTLLVVSGLVVLTRLLPVRGLEAPSWGDSVQHAVQARLMVDNGGLFTSWEPYAPYESLTTHFGFASVAALLQWGLGWQVARATLVAGQLVNVAAVVGWYPVAVRLSKGRRWAGVAAVLAAGLLMPMPAEYANWGRFAQLAGQAALPASLWLLMQALDRPQGGWRLAALGGVALAGMTLCYYRMPYYYAPFVLAWLVGWGVPALGRAWRGWLRVAGKLALTGGVAAALLAPWLLRMVGGKLATSVETGTKVSYTWAMVVAEYEIWRNVGEYAPPALLALAASGAAVAVLRRNWSAMAAGFWALGLAGLVATRMVNLPGANLIDNFAVLIAFYMPVCLLVGSLVGDTVDGARWLAGRAASSSRPLVRLLAATPSRMTKPLLSLLVLVVALMGARDRLDVVDSRYVMVTRPDTRAMRWIAANVSPSARFLVEGFRIYGGRSAVGADAGWWLPVLAGRDNTMPPQYALLNEVPAEPDYSSRVVQLVAQLEEAPVGSPEGLAVLCAAGVTHVYVGQGQGNIGAGVVQLYSADELARAPWFTEVYREDLVRVYVVSDGACEVGGR